MQLHLQNQFDSTFPSRNSPSISFRLRQLYPHSFNIDSQRWQTPIEPQFNLPQPPEFPQPSPQSAAANSEKAPFTFAQAFKARLFPQYQSFAGRDNLKSKARETTQITSTSFSWMPQQQRIFLAGGWLVALFTIAINLGGAHGGRVNASAMEQSLCKTIVQSNAGLSRAQLAQVLTVPERSPQSDIRAQLPQPYCQLEDIEMRAGITAQREAYPLAFDPQTWLVLLFEEDEYAGYAFQF